MSASPPEKRKVYQRSGNVCAFPNCRVKLTADATGQDRLAALGEVAHIVGEKADGPRGDSPLSTDERNQYENLVLLCEMHHQLIDTQVNTWSVEILHQIKADHEAWVARRLSEGDDLSDLPTAPSASLAPYELLGHTEYLQMLQRTALSRRELRRYGAGLSADQVERSLTVPVAIPGNLADFDGGQCRALVGPLGSGKSDIAEQWHLDSIDDALQSDSSPVPVWVSVKELHKPLEEQVMGEIGAAILASVGADIVVDGLDEKTDTAPLIISQATNFAIRWPKSRVLLTSRSSDGIPKRCLIDAPLLDLYQADYLMRAVAGYSIGIANERIAEAVQRPLFALLVARHVTAPSGTTGIPELIDLVVEDAVATAGYDLYPQLQQLAIETIRSGRAVDPERFTTADMAARIRTSPLITRTGRACAFSLATFEQWFATKAMLEGALEIEGILTSLQVFDRWKYVLAIVMAAGEPERADPIMAAVARWNPGAAAWLVRETRAGGLTRQHPDFGPEDWEVVGHRLRRTAVAWLEGLGPLAAGTYPVQLTRSTDLDGMTLAVGVNPNSLTLAWLISNEDGAELLPPVCSLPLQSLGRSVSLRTQQIPTGVNWVWEAMQDHFAQDIDASLQSLAMAVGYENPGVVHDERIEAAREKNAFWANDPADEDTGPAPLYAGPDQFDDFSPWPTYSLARMEQRMNQVFRSVLTCYRQLCDALAPKFGDTLGHRGLMPVQFYANISYHPDQEREPFGYPGPPEPWITWMLRPIGAPSPDCRRRGHDDVSITVNDRDRREELHNAHEAQYEEFVSYFKAQPAIEPFAPAFTTHQGRFDIRRDYPATNLALSWLREDLKKLGWATRR